MRHLYPVTSLSSCGRLTTEATVEMSSYYHEIHIHLSVYGKSELKSYVSLEYAYVAVASVQQRLV